jgi:hypothetical protein
MNSSKLSNLQQQFLDTYLDTGNPLPPLSRGLTGYKESELDLATRHASRAADVEEWYMTKPQIRTRAQITAQGLLKTNDRLLQCCAVQNNTYARYAE